MKSMTAMEKMGCSCHGVNFSAVWQKVYFLYTWYDVHCTLWIFLDNLLSCLCLWRPELVLCIHNNKQEHVGDMCFAMNMLGVITKRWWLIWVLCWSQGQCGRAWSWDHGNQAVGGCHVHGHHRWQFTRVWGDLRHYCVFLVQWFSICGLWPSEHTYFQQS